jgi:hypothetical protein
VSTSTVKWLVLAAAVLLGTAGLPGVAFAQGDEIQVYDASLAPVGVFNLTWHNNYTPDGIKTPEFPGAITSNKSLNGVTEWAYGITDWFEGGLYLPLYSRDENLGWKIDGFKLRTLFAVPNAADRTFFYGANFEFSVNAKWWDTKRFTSEVRPIVGWHLNQFDLIFNPIVDTQYDGLKNLEFVPSSRFAYNPSPRWAAALELYSDYGRVSDFAPVNNQSHQLFAVFDYSGALDIEAGIGFGLTDASDKLQFKLIVARDLNRKSQTATTTKGTR